MLSGEMPAACYLTSTSSTVKFSVALGGMVGFTPDVPYACMSHASAHWQSWYGMPCIGTASFRRMPRQASTPERVFSEACMRVRQQIRAPDTANAVRDRACHLRRNGQAALVADAHALNPAVPAPATGCTLRSDNDAASQEPDTSRNAGVEQWSATRMLQVALMGMTRSSGLHRRH